MKVKSLALVCALVACAGVAKATQFNLDLPNTSVTLELKLNGADILIPATQAIPITGGAITATDNGSSLSNVLGTGPSAGLLVASPWNVNTLLGNLALTGGHLSIGDLGAGNVVSASPGPFNYSGGNIDVSGLGLVLDGGAGTILGNTFDFGTSPVGFSVPSPTTGSYNGTELIIPTVVSGSTSISLGGSPATLTYTIAGQVAFTKVPEPGTVALAVLGLCSVAPLAVRRLRKGR
ncbi:MAG TPA: PEP-CTERM sorting domain-containing protein [Pirellulales bacterium]|nr:PEP-CTERM sorting domain-containing protein [Pirellulales bacterium]